jgi:glutathione synthase/RimK-type ligase-like ATP-grasp enzyme
MRDDPHVKAVTWGLRLLGHEPVIWYWAEFPKNETATLHIGPAGQTSFKLGLQDGPISAPFDAIWVRRRDEPESMPRTHPDDMEVVLSESNKFFDNILLRMGHAATRWVNHPYGDYRCRNKATQLLTAQSLGFRIPESLIGNDAEDVRAFFARHPGGIIHKAFAPKMWKNEDGSRTTARTSLITSAHLASEFAVRACPGIYQEKIEKQHELRVTVMGETVFAAAIDSQRDGATIDWRCEGGRGRTNLRATDIAPALAARCRALCRELGLSFGCIDLIVTPAEEVIFLEINCAGQFLFNELVDPTLPMLEAFCRYLAGETIDPAVGPDQALSLAQYDAWLQAASRSAA